jgi:outer membrane protein OmpA-like peptidoglycan-associated protein
MKKIILLFVFILIALNAKDIKGSKDVEFLKRFKGSEIVAYKYENYNKFILPLAPLQEIKGKKDNHNNHYFAPKTSKKVYGKHIRVVYKMPPNTSVLEATKNYEDEVNRLGGKILFSCEGNECGGDTTRASGGGGGDMSLIMFFEHEEDVNTYNKDFSPGECALLDWINNLTYFNAEIPSMGAYLSVVGYKGQGQWCKNTKNRVYIILDLIISKKRENKMVQVKANEMKEKISKEGKIALYGIYFDTDKAIIKPKSEPTIKEIAKLLKDNPKLKLLIVGHTDNQGTFVYNKGLSQRRAKAVVKELVTKYGINANRLHPVGVSYAAPVASNNTEEGRAKNRRVELVELSK